MANKPKRSDESRRKRRILIAAVAIFLVVISVLAYASSLRQSANTAPPPGKRASSSYFIISDVAGTYTSHGKNSTDPNPGPSVRITTFGFQFTPIGGPATDVAIFMEGMDDPTNHYWAGITIPNGTSIYSGDIQPLYSLLSQRQDDGTYQLRIRINSLQADGYVVLTFTAGENLFGIST
jgi:hypothetical protein